MIASERLAIASVGISCTAAFQMNLHVDSVGYHARTDMVHRATPFDWQLCSVASATRMIRDGAYFPEDTDELTYTEHRPHWPRYGNHYWHDKLGVPKEWVSKQRHVAANWKRIHESKRKVFICSNVAWKSVNKALLDRGGMETRFDFDGLVGLHLALSKEFGPHELHVVTGQDVLAVRPSVLLVGKRPPITVHRFDDRCNWQGDSPSWGKLFAKIVP